MKFVKACPDDADDWPGLADFELQTRQNARFLCTCFGSRSYRTWPLFNVLLLLLLLQVTFIRRTCDCRIKASLGHLSICATALPTQTCRQTPSRHLVQCRSRTRQRGQNFRKVVARSPRSAREAIARQTIIVNHKTHSS